MRLLIKKINHIGGHKMYNERADKVKEHLKSVDLQSIFNKCFPEFIFNYFVENRKEEVLMQEVLMQMDDLQISCNPKYVVESYALSYQHDYKGQIEKLKKAKEGSKLYNDAKCQCFLNLFGFAFVDITSDKNNSEGRGYEHKILVSVKDGYFDEVFDTIYELLLTKHDGFSRRSKFSNNFIKPIVDRKISGLKRTRCCGLFYLPRVIKEYLLYNPLQNYLTNHRWFVIYVNTGVKFDKIEQFCKDLFEQIPTEALEEVPERYFGLLSGKIGIRYDKDSNRKYSEKTEHSPKYKEMDVRLNNHFGLDATQVVVDEDTPLLGNRV